MQALYAQSSISAGMKGASKAMEAMNKVEWFIICFDYISCPWPDTWYIAAVGFILVLDTCYNRKTIFGYLSPKKIENKAFVLRKVLGIGAF